MFSCREFTWHDTLIELVRLNQAGVEMSKGTSEYQAICSSAPIRTLTGTLRLGCNYLVSLIDSRLQLHVLEFIERQSFCDGFKHPRWY